MGTVLLDGMRTPRAVHPSIMCRADSPDNSNPSAVYTNSVRMQNRETAATRTYNSMGFVSTTIPSISPNGESTHAATRSIDCRPNRFALIQVNWWTLSSRCASIDSLSIRFYVEILNYEIDRPRAAATCYCWELKLAISLNYWIHYAVTLRANYTIDPIQLGSLNLSNCPD